MNSNGDVLSEITSDQGMSTLQQIEFETVLLSHIEPWINDEVMPVMACGMVGSRQGWAEAPYAETPTIAAQKSVKVTNTDPRIDVHIIAGIKQNNPADVMRGEETQIAGYLSNNSGFQGILVLPGTHSKWVLIQDGKVISFNTFLTGELYALLSKGSVLKHSMGKWNDAAYEQTLDNVFNSQTEMTGHLFGVRAEHLLNVEADGSAKLSGTIIGAEIKSMKHLWDNKNICIIGSGKLVPLYEKAFKFYGKKAESICANDLTLLGLKKSYNEIYK